MHQIYTTPGFILDSRPHSDAGKYLAIFTRDLGLVWAMAQGIRLEKSKLRGYVSEYSFGTFSLVRGKDIWRLTSAEEIEMSSIIGKNISNEQICKQKEFWARIALLLRRLLQGEEANIQLFNTLYSANTFLNNSISPVMDYVESLLVLRIMHSLGYVGDDKEIHSFLCSNDFDPALLDLVCQKRIMINQHINKALKESHL